MGKKHNALKAVAKGSSKMALATLISRFLGLLREQVMAGLFGASGLSDAFFIAYRIPNLLRGLFAEGAFSSAFVPTFILANKEGGVDKSRQLMWRVFVKLALITSALSVIVMIFSDEIVSLFVNDLFKQDQKRFELAVELTQMMAPYLCLTSLAAVFMGALNSFQSYFIPALAPAIFNIVVISCAFLLPPYLSNYLNAEYTGIYAISYGIVIGGFFQLIFQLPQVFKKGLGYQKSKIKYETKALEKSILKKMGPGVLGTAAQHMNLLITTILATGSAVGAVSWLTYAFRLFQFPVGVIGVSIGNSFLVEFSRSVKNNDQEKAGQLFKSSQQFSLFLLLPITAVTFLGAESLVAIIFQRGAFDASSTYQTAFALKLYSLGLPFYGYYKTLNASLYALERAKLPVIISAFAISLSIFLSWLLIDKYGFGVLALSNGVTFLVNILLMAIVMKRILNWGIGQYLNKKIIQYLILAFFIMLGAFYIFDEQNIKNWDFVKHFVYLIKITLFVFITWGGGCFLLGRRSFFTRN